MDDLLSDCLLMTPATRHTKRIMFFPLMLILALAAVPIPRYCTFAQSAKPLAAGAAAVGPAASTLAAQRTPVLVELFTSEGCSSCPPADALLARLDLQQPIAGAEVIVLEQHVDYWDDQGWRDPFASKAATDRQKEYAFRLGADVYTPQMIIDGRTVILGSDEPRARYMIQAAEKSPKAEIHIAWSGDAAGDSRMLQIHAGNLPGAAPTAASKAASGSKTSTNKYADVFLVITESHLHSDVRRGENAGRGLEHDGVVRQFVRLGQAALGAETSFESQTAVKLAKEWERENLRAVVFVQDPHTLQVFGSAAIPF